MLRNVDRGFVLTAGCLVVLITAWLLGVITLIAGCAPRPEALVPASPGVSAEVVRVLSFCPDRTDCRGWAPFARLRDADIPGPVWWLISTSGRACEIAPAAPYREGQLWSCAWRSPR